MRKARTFSQRLEDELKRIQLQEDKLDKRIEVLNDEKQIVRQQIAALRQALKAFSKVTVSDGIYAILSASDRGFGIGEIDNELRRQDIYTTYAQTSAALNKDKRFKRIGNGLYALNSIAKQEPTFTDQGEIEVEQGDEIDKILAAERVKS